jgi:hypothetical protein
MKSARLIIGLLAVSAIGYGAFTYFQNTPPSAPTAPPAPPAAAARNAESERIARLEKEIADLKSRPVAAAPPATEEKPADGQPADLKKILKDATPLIQSLSSAFEPQRKEMVARFIDDQVKRATELAGLSPDQAAALKAHLETLDKENQDKMKGMMSKEMNMEELMAMGRNGGANNPQKAIDDWAAASLTGEQAQTYKTKRLTEKTEQITKSANSKVESLGKDLGLDETQKDKVFNILVQTDRNYDPSMALEGVNATAGVSEGQSRDEAIASVLTPEQKSKYDAKQAAGNDRRERFRQMLGVDPGAFPQP